MSKYLEFIIVDNRSYKTWRWSVISKNQGICLGEIKWFGRWRQYCFFPEKDTVFNKQCLSDIENFIEVNKNKRGNYD